MAMHAELSAYLERQLRVRDGLSQADYEVLALLSENFLLVKPDEAEAAIDELRRMGHAPRIVR